MKYTKFSSVAISVLLLGSCSTVSQDAARQNEVFNADLQGASAEGRRNDPTMISIGKESDQDANQPLQITEYRDIPAFGEAVEEVVLESAELPEFPGGEISVLIPPQPVPDFIDTVFGELLGLGYTLDPSIANRQEIVTYRSAPNITREKLYASAQAALLPYGIAVTYEEGEIRAVLRDDLLRQSPRFIRARARGSVPSNLRPIVQYVEVNSTSVSSIATILNQVFTDRSELKVYGLDSQSALLLTGLPETIERAERIIAEMDEIRFARARVATIPIRNWDLKELTTVVENQLSIEGFAVTSNKNVIRSINLFPIEYTGQLVIFARDPEMLAYAVDTAERLDASAQVDKDVRAYVYKAKFYEAGKLLDIITGQDFSADSQGPASVQFTAGVAQTLPEVSPSRQGLNVEGSAFDVNFTVDEQGNRLIYMASEEQHREISGLLRVIDTPQDEVLIDVSIAEVTLTDMTSYGLDFMLSQLGSQGYSIGFGTGGGIGLGTGGLSGEYTSGDYVINFSALATNNQINVLSSPRLVVKSGATGSIQVGTDVPIITSQAASSNQSGGSTDILQSVEYRETGVLLDIEPLVLSNDRIDIKVSQEVSAAEDNGNQAIASPVISSRQIQTELTLQDGQSAILGGLIENRYSRGTTGVPLAKDIPILGNLFKTETLNARRTMLLVMITPYVLTTRSDRSSNVQVLTEAMNEAFENQVDESMTLLKPEVPFEIEPKD